MSKEKENTVLTVNKTDIQYFDYHGRFSLESGETLPGFRLGYHAFGHLNEKKDNVIWIFHALTGNSNPVQWWSGVVGEGFAIDPEEYYIICVNSIGSPYGSTCPLSVNPDTGRPWYHQFPLITNRDIAGSFDLLRQHLNIEQIKMLCGASLGGQQALEWSLIRPEVFDNLLLIACNAKHSPWGIAFNESQRLAISADQSWREDRFDAGEAGLLAARSIALLSYRTSMAYNISQTDDTERLDGFRAQSYQRYQGEKLVERFNAFSYWTLSKAMDSHDIGRGRNGLIHALSGIQAKTMVAGIQSDLLFPLEEQAFLAKHIPGSGFEVIHSDLGHDGFLTETEQISSIIERVLNKEVD